MLRVDVRAVTGWHWFQRRAVPECSSACTRPRSWSAAPGIVSQGGISQLHRKPEVPQVPFHRCLCFLWCQHTVNGMLELAVLNVSFINSCYGNWQIFINRLRRSPLPLGFAAAALEHGAVLLTRFPNPGVLPGSLMSSAFTRCASSYCILLPGCLLQITLENLSFF